MSKQTDVAKTIRMLAGETTSPTKRVEAMNLADDLDRQAAIDDKRYDDSMKLQEIGKSAMESIVEMVAALEVDYDRLEQLADERADFMSNWLEANPEAELDSAPAMAEELKELLEEAGECKDRGQAEQFIHEDPLSVQVRGPWYDLAANRGASFAPEEFEILLGTGGPATRIIGELTDGEPTRVRLQAQDWGTPWTDYVGADQDTLLSYCRCFYFGEG